MANIEQSIRNAHSKYVITTIPMQNANMHKFVFKEGLGETMMITDPTHPLRLTNQSVTSEGEPKVGSVVFEDEQASKYDGITPILVIGLGSIMALDEMFAVTDIDNALGLNPVYPNANDLSAEDIIVLIEQVKNVIGKSKGATYTSVDRTSVIRLEFGETSVVIRIIWSLNAVSIEYGNFIVARVFAGNPTLTVCLEHVINMRSVLYRMVKANTGFIIPTKDKNRIATAINTYITKSVKYIR